MITKQMVRDALAELYINRSKAEGFKYVRSILATHGNGALTIHDLQPEYYDAVYAARWRSSSARAAAPNHGMSRMNRQRRQYEVQTPLVRDLERRLAAARLKTKQSAPDGPANLGDASRVGDQPDDAGEPVMPPGERLVR